MYEPSTAADASATQLPVNEEVLVRGRPQPATVGSNAVSGARGGFAGLDGRVRYGSAGTADRTEIHGAPVFRASRIAAANEQAAARAALDRLADRVSRTGGGVALHFTGGGAVAAARAEVAELGCTILVPLAMVTDPFGVVLIVAATSDSEQTEDGHGDTQAGHRAIVAETDIGVQPEVQLSLCARS